MNGQALVEALIASMPSGPRSSTDRLWYDIPSAVVDFPCEGVVTIAVRRRVGHRDVGKPHDVTIDLDDRMVASKTGGAKLVAVIEKALASISLDIATPTT